MMPHQDSFVASRFFLVFPVFLFSFFFCPQIPSSGQEMLEEDSRITVDHDHEGRPVMIIDYFWEVHEEPSIEICRPVEGETSITKRKPLAFRAHDFQGYIQRVVDRCHREGAEIPTYAKVEVQGIPMTVIGKRNFLRKPAVSLVGVEKLPLELESQQKDLAQTVTWAIFPVLSPWAYDAKKLCLTLPETFFSRPQPLRVSFLRGKQKVWEETIQWPGFLSVEEGKGLEEGETAEEATPEESENTEKSG
jgi:hypothetical protein